MKPRLRLSRRFFMIPAIFTIGVVAWNLYVSSHNDGIVRGRVVGPDGLPVAGATVKLTEQNFTTNSARGQATTSADGRFEFTDNRSHNIQLQAAKSGFATSAQRTVRLYFRAQNVDLQEPLQLGGGQ